MEPSWADYATMAGLVAYLLYSWHEHRKLRRLKAECDAADAALLRAIDRNTRRLQGGDK